MWDFLAAILDLGSFSAGRVSVADRYEMKKKVRAIRMRERAEKRAAEIASPAK